MKKIHLKKHKEESLLRFHPWVFSGAIARTEGQPEEGDLVSVWSADGLCLGTGHWQEGSIAVRILAFGTDTLPADFWEQRLSAAYRMRCGLGLVRPDNNAYRLVHGEGDFLPGLIADVYDDTAVVQAHSAGMHRARRQIAEALVRIVPAVKNVYYKSEGTLPLRRHFSDIADGYLTGGESTCLALENGLSFGIDWLRGQKTGFFLDQRENRALVERYSAGRRVLNMFCYTGGFSVYALRGGAELVHSVDSSEKAVELVNRNVERNFPGCSRHQAFCEEAFAYLSSLQTDAGTPRRPYDLIILDPPAFAKHRGAIKNALQGYKRLNAKAFELIAPGGILFTFSCSQAVDKDMFRLAVFSAAAMTGRKVRILHQLHQPQDHPINIYHPEGEYLKGLVLYVE
ncbi:MAG: class I SAM-dependent rRNA methyltransferase [Paludibacteraceae bacterium]|nr:class I SAM-dependent rRNA methyltransferase [Paludibacteraceae bacterium]